MNNVSCEGGADLLKLLPIVVRRTMLNQRAFSQAVEEGYIRISADGRHLDWMLENKTLLAYFIGRIWCGDTSLHVRRNGGSVRWILGERSFPDDAMYRLFGVKNLRQKRNRRMNYRLPKNFYLIDNLFVSSTRVVMV